MKTKIERIEEDAIKTFDKLGSESTFSNCIIGAIYDEVGADPVKNVLSSQEVQELIMLIEENESNKAIELLEQKLAKAIEALEEMALGGNNPQMLADKILEELK